MSLRYLGSGPYCYANSLAMVLGSDGAMSEPSAIEVLTGSPFGFQLIDDVMPFFDPAGWDPDQGLDAAIDLLGWDCTRHAGGDASAAIARLREAIRTGPALVGPIEFGLLLHHPDSGTPIGSDHFVVVLNIDGDSVLFHDPNGHPFATMPIESFLISWRAETIGYATDCYVMRTDFRHARPVTIEAAIERSLPNAVRWLNAGDEDRHHAKLLGASLAVMELAKQCESGFTQPIRDHLTYFAIRVGARRLADASFWLAELGIPAAAAICDRQARLIGSLQYDIVAGNTDRAVKTLRDLAPTYEDLSSILTTKG